jgi:hypothetical protein
MRNIKARLVIEDKEVTIDELQMLFMGYLNTLKSHSIELNKHVAKTGNLINLLFTVMKDGKSTAFMIPEIDLKHGLERLVEASVIVENPIRAREYDEVYDMLIREFMSPENQSTVMQTQRFIGMTVIITKVKDEGKEQKERMDQALLSQKQEYVLVPRDEGLVLDLSLAV